MSDSPAPTKAILIVDDEAIILLSLRQELRTKLGSDYYYEIAKSAEEGLRVIDELSGEGVLVVLIISDWLMPGMKGDEFIGMVRERHPNVRTILLSGMADEATITKVLDSGDLDAYVRKPWNPHQLAKTCKELLEAEKA
mgnify:FL=1